MNKIKPGSLDWVSGKVAGFYGKDFINLNNGSVKLVKISPHHKYPIHHHPEKTEYAYVLNGSPEFFIDQNHFNSEAGDFFIFPVNCSHAIENNTNQECQLLIGAIKNQ
ncbi:MAG TPA: cupin domain-containing protein [Ferruginibacter sp.]|jgi:quercetin dioxygenase-like cupin family protein|nr:cupin domain-containing protein [Bacteroidota bacterium]MCC6692354.1 cupin domain-containing protein [Chitinophagaceae bacterium]HMT96765.1 cupin domain-containing protein [Ferruginibacter sp.]MBS1925111.1 cupin domain-containing protein [Bacteroidota bacterium]HMU25231.1 cupin domain-containing protein [Ferruginibacter sp.]